MAAEAQPVIEKLGIEKMPDIKGLPFRMYAGHAYGQQVVLMTSGVDPTTGVDNVGTVVAAVMAHTGIRKFGPDLVLNFGTAGGFKTCGAEIGSLYLCDRFRFHDRKIPFPGFLEYGIGDYVFTTPKELSGKFQTATATSGDSFSATGPERVEMLVLACRRLLVKDMEAAAIAKVCYWSEQPFLALKAVTDLVDGGGATQEEFVENLRFASEMLRDGVVSFLRAFGSR